MSDVSNAVVQAFTADIAGELVFAQVLIQRLDSRFELRHVADQLIPKEQLSLKTAAELRSLAQHTTEGQFRPLHAAPNLMRGWRCLVSSEPELGLALQGLYPGALADWYVVRSTGVPPVSLVTHYRDFSGRQSGMYRITAKLDDHQATVMIRACCHPRFCLKQRLWTAAELSPDDAGTKSLIPCLEPCAMVLEFARKAMRIEQEEKMKLELSPSDLETILAALEKEATTPEASLREADFATPNNSRRAQLVWEKLNAQRPITSVEKPTAGE